MNVPDRRRWPCNGHVAAERLRGEVAADVFVTPDPRRVIVPVADLRSAPDGPRDRQLLYGDDVDVLETAGAWAFVEAVKDGYTGYVSSGALGARAAQATHRVSAASTHVYPEPDFKSPERLRLSCGAELAVSGEAGRFCETAAGFVPSSHVLPLYQLEADPVAVAGRLLNTPYLWGGNSRDGIDCSGLVQIACRACGIVCPGDSDMQAAELGEPLADDAPLMRGDLLFWQGHVAWVVDATRILHANAWNMAVTEEDMDAAIARIAAQGDGPVTGRRRILRPA